MMYAVLFILALACAPTMQQQHISNLQRRAVIIKLSRFAPNHTCFGIRDGGMNAIDRCLDCFNKAYEGHDPAEADLPQDAKPCVDLLPKVFKVCGESDPVQLECLKMAYTKHLKRIVKTFWISYIKHFNEEERGILVQLLAYIKLIHTIHNDNKQDFHVLNDTTAVCRTRFLEKIRTTRDVDGETQNNDAEEFGTIDDNGEAKEEEDEEMDEVARLRNRMYILQDYMKCRMEEYSKSPDAITILKTTIKKYHHNIPAMMVNALYV